MTVTGLLPILLHLVMHWSSICKTLSLCTVDHLCLFLIVYCPQKEWVTDLLCSLPSVLTFLSGSTQGNRWIHWKGLCHTLDRVKSRPLLSFPGDRTFTLAMRTSDGWKIVSHCVRFFQFLVLQRSIIPYAFPQRCSKPYGDHPGSFEDFLHGLWRLD